MSKRAPTKDASSLGEVTSGASKGSEAGLTRLASPHPSVRYILDVLERLRARGYATNAVIGGEPGTGKEGLAHTLHELMHPDGGKLVTVSTSGRPEEVVAAELFGAAPTQKGDRATEGALAEADGGTLVLDEVIGLSPQLQRRLLEVVKNGRYHRNGEERERRTQLSIIVVTDGNIAAEVQAGRFRHDLYHKLARLDFVLPPLRERPEDIPAAARWMANRVRATRGLSTNVVLDGEPVTAGTIVIRKDALDLLRLQRWPGNFRELEVVIERALLLFSDGTQLTAPDVSKALSDPRG
jgi:anaerobic nitric oxide reductase transcription regulator